MAVMRAKSFLFLASLTLGVCTAAAQNPLTRLKEAVKVSTLDQAGTHPFHLKAELAPTYERDKDSGRTGEVEIWWMSPTHYRRELRCPDFHEIEIVDGATLWQRNEGDYLPEWLHAIAEKLIEPVTPEELNRAKSAEVRSMFGTTYFQWTEMSSDGTVQKGMGAGIDLNQSTGLLRLNSEGKEDYREFHERTIAHEITDGSPEVKATVTVLEDLPAFAKDFMDASQAGGDSHPIRVVRMEETTLRRSLVPGDAPVWPALRDGPLEGVLTVNIVVDRSGKVRNCGLPVSDNPGTNEAACKYIAGLQFKPIVQNGEPVEVTSRFTMPFKTTRPAGMEVFDSARNYFESGRKAGFPATGSTPYLMRAEFEAKGASGELTTGHYEDTFQDERHWRREAWFGASHIVHSRDGEKRYRFEEGPQVGLLRLILRVTEPIPAVDTFVESDWRINSTDENGIREVRVLTGYESPDGKLDPEHARGYWFDDSLKLMKTYSNGLETRRSKFESFAGIQVARSVNVYSNGGLALKLTVTELTANPSITPKLFDVKGHEWTRQFTDEVR